ncbi:Hypothetical predicted protein [Pelobates cultripes]|uniref:Uncharacterized protein n=1 Tax=Pelobates cultripes TaxID=61616 RepID=A0AAD1RV88_PELCU|nr:Hypothetical predicted protein [Pelobates cultripes]
MDLVCQSAEKACLKQIQDGDYPAAHSPASDSPSESEPLAVQAEDSPVTDKSLKVMLMQVQTMLQLDFQQLSTTSVKKWRIWEVGPITSSRRLKNSEQAHNEFADRLQRLEEDHATLKHKVADVEDRARRNNI